VVCECYSARTARCNAPHTRERADLSFRGAAAFGGGCPGGRGPPLGFLRLLWVYTDAVLASDAPQRRTSSGSGPPGPPPIIFALAALRVVARASFDCSERRWSVCDAPAGSWRGGGTGREPMLPAKSWADGMGPTVRCGLGTRRPVSCVVS
jgi:hypothetical protein